jgi:hypothetical protein
MMKKHIFFISVGILALAALPVMGMQGHDIKSGDKMDQGAHGAPVEQSGMGGTFKHMATQGGIDAEFQVMRLASMNMTSDKGETHHIMVRLKAVDSGAPIKDAIGKIKVIGPDKTEQEGVLENYNGILAANFTFKAPGKYGVICLLKVKAQKEGFKFWYSHMQ